MADKPSFPLILGIPMFIDNVRVNPEYVKEVMKYVKYTTTSHYSAINNVTCVAHFPDGFTLAIAQSPTIFGSGFDENAGRHYAQLRAKDQAHAKVFEMLGAVLYFQESNVLTVRNVNDLSEETDETIQALWREKWGYTNASYDSVQVCQNKYTGKEAKLILEQYDSSQREASYGSMGFVMNLPALPTANAEVWTTDDFKFIYDYSNENGVERIVMMYFMNFFEVKTGEKVRSELMQVKDANNLFAGSLANAAGCCSGPIQIPGGELIKNESDVGAFVSSVAVQMIEKFLKDDLKGRYRDPFPV